MSTDLRPLRGLDLNLLVTLRTLVTTCSVSDTAAQLDQSEARVQRDLDALTDAFGDPLLVRSGAGWVPSRVADDLLPHVQAALAGIDRLAQLGRFVPSTSDRAFRLSMDEGLASLWMPTLVAILRPEAPHVRLTVVDPPPDVVDQLARGTIDLHLGAGLSGPDLSTQALGAGPWGWSLVVGSAHPRADAEAWSAEDAAASEQVIYTGMAAPQDGPGGHSTLRVAHLAALADLLLLLPVTACLPTPVAQRLIQGRQLRAVPHPQPPPPLPILQTWHASHQGDAGHAWLRERVFEAALLSG